ncbi:TetR/AcrR family transcriptional regulator [Enterovirga sp. CN4-39]|uniref:TetR/AcrR family transcriptional regulator n=1 Tax=Enterovirga sp. CN4-39 TaxID=3400910 RepID=UPI003C114AA6
MVQNKEVRRRGRPPAYDAEQALARALETFWTSGFEATSLDELSTATGMNRPSLYGAFGDKRALFLKALMAYRARGEMGLSQLITDNPSVRDALVNTCAAALKLYFSGEKGARGCFMTGAALVGAVSDPELREALLEGLEDIDRAFVALFEHGQRRGEVARDADPEALAFMASALLHTLSVRARAGAKQPDLVRAAAKGVDVLLRAARP